METKNKIANRTGGQSQGLMIEALTQQPAKGLTMRLDREYQLKLLSMLSEHFPNNYYALAEHLPPESTDEVEAKYVANILYLEEHGLVVSHVGRNLDGTFNIGAPIITANGLDFLKDDGGLRAILGIVTVRLEADTLKAILEAKINESHADQSLKIKMISQLRDLPLAATKHLASELLKKALDHLPDAIQSIQNLLY